MEAADTPTATVLTLADAQRRAAQHPTSEPAPGAPYSYGEPIAGEAPTLASIAAQLDELLGYVRPLAVLLADAGPMLDQLAEVGEAVSKGGIMGLLKMGK